MTFSASIFGNLFVFFDDILVYSRDLQSHVHHLEVVLSILRNQKLYANMRKCHFTQLKLEYLGHIISADRVAANPSKIEAMQRWSTPQNLKELRGFLGLTGYYRKFVAGYGKIAYPLTKQLKKDNFGWTYEVKHAFNQLKHAMTTVPILALPDFDKPFVIETDASGVDVGAVLMQDQCPIAYYNHILPQQNRLKSVYERELMAIFFAIQRWLPYLLGRQFFVRTD